MKIRPSSNAVLYRASPQGFRQLLADAQATEQKLKSVGGNRTALVRVSPLGPMPKPKPMAVVPKTTPVSNSGQLAQARALSHEQAQQLAAERADAFESRGHRLDARQIDLICKELLLGAANDAQSERPPGVPPPPQIEPLRTAPPVDGDVVRQATARARAAIELARRIEVFLGSSGPALELPLTETLGASVHLERIGPGEVALTLKGTRGPPRAEAVSRIREAIAARGIRIGALTVG